MKRLLSVLLLVFVFSYIGYGAETKATGGTITTVGNYIIHTFTENGDFTPSSSFNVEVLVVAGGGGGGGGVLVIRYSTYSDSGSVTANGGTGGAEAHTPDHANGGNGGAGGGGTVWVVNA